MSLIISKSNQSVLDLATTISKSTNDADFFLPLNTNTGLPLTYTSSDTNIASIVNNKVIIKKAGNVTITANQIGNESYNPLSQNVSLIISETRNNAKLYAYINDDSEIEISGKVDEMIVYNLEGKIIYNGIQKKVKIDTSGLYMVIGSNSDGKNYFKLIKY